MFHRSKGPDETLVRATLMNQFDAGKMRRSAVRVKFGHITHLRLYPEKNKLACLCGEMVKGKEMRYHTGMCTGCMDIFKDTIEEWIDERTYGLSMLDAPEIVVKFKFLMMTNPSEWFNRL